MDYNIVCLRDKPDMKHKMANWFCQKWGIPLEAYLESMEACLENHGIPQWYVVMEEERIVGGVGVIANDFHNRLDLTPNVCAVYVEEDKRKQGICRMMLDYVCHDMALFGYNTLYLLTDHTSLYERYGWEFYCFVQGDGEEHLSRMYIYKK